MLQSWSLEPFKTTKQIKTPK